MNVVLKPSSKNTTHWLQASLLAVMPIILRPTNASIDWLSDAHVVRILHDFNKKCRHTDNTL